MRQLYILMDWFFWNTVAFWLAAGASGAIMLAFRKKSKKLMRVAQIVTITVVLVGVCLGINNINHMTRCDSCNEPLYREDYYMRCQECRLTVKITNEFSGETSLPDEAWKWQENQP